MTKTVKIAGHQYRVKFKKNLQRDFNAQGMSCDTNLTILLDPSGKKSHQKEVLAHEIVEQWNYRYEIGLSHDKITILGIALFQLLEENPNLMEKLA